MPNEKNAISEAELEIMKALWKLNKPANTQTINQSVAHKQWKRTTVSTLLARLAEKGAVSSKNRETSTITPR